LIAPPPTPQGCEVYEADSGCLVLRLHYSCDPEKTPAWAAAEKRAEARKGNGEKNWRREMELDCTVYDGDPVYEDYTDSIHCPKWLQENDWEPQKGSRYILGVDCGQTLNPAAVLLEVGPAPFHQIAAVLEVVSDGFEPMSKFCPRVLDILARRFPWWDDIKWVGDNTVTQRSGTNGRSAWDEARQFGQDIKPMTNLLHARIGAVTWALCDWIDADSPRFFICGKNCPTLLAGFRGGYRLKEPVGKNASEKDAREPDKFTKFSHPHDALQYAMMEAQRMIKGTGNSVRKLSSYAPRRHND